jgi:hypothetical protein
MRAAVSKAVALNVYHAIKDNVTRYLRGEIGRDKFHAQQVALWERAERAGRSTVRRVDDLFRAEWTVEPRRRAA